MSRPTLRFVLGTTRRRALEAFRVARGRLRRHPPCASLVPRPARSRGRSLELTHALVACDLSPRYLDFWPLVRRAWKGVVGLETVLVLIAEEEQVPPSMRDDGDVHVVTPVAGVHPAFQAQSIRLLYPALLDAGGVVVSDLDMAPMSARYFRRPLTQIDRDHFVAYRDVLLPAGEIPICYNAALPQTWGDAFGVETIDDVRARLAEWGAEVEYAGEHGGAGWGADQQLLYRALADLGRRRRSVWILDDYYTGFRRLERTSLSKRGEVDDEVRREIARGGYSDFHCVHPFDESRALNETAVELAVEVAQLLDGRRTRGR